MSGIAVLAGMLVEAGVKGTVVLATAGLGSVLLRRRSAAARHAAWLAAIVCLALLPVLSALLPRMAVVNLQRRVQGAPMGAAAAAMRAGDEGRPSVAADRLRVTDEAAAMAPAPAVSVPVWSLNWEGLLVAVWLAGVGVCLAPLVAGSVLMRRWIGRHSAAVNRLESELLAELQGRIGKRRGVRVSITEGEHMPLATGFLRPRIFLPRSSVAWARERLRAVLLHELGHIERRDLETQALARVVRTVYWFHPLAWMACRRMDIEREKACDDLVVSQGMDAPAYARTLLDLATLFHGRLLMRYAVVSMARPSTLETRIRAILRPGAARGAMTRRALVAMAGAAVALSAGLAALAAAPVRNGPGGAVSATAANGGAAALPAGTVSIVAIGADQGGPFWTAEGQPTLIPEALAVGAPTAGNRLCILKVHAPGADASPPVVVLRQGNAAREIQVSRVAQTAGILTVDGKKTVIPAAPGSLPQVAGEDVYYSFGYPKSGQTTVDVGIATGAWKTFAESDHAASGKTDGGSYVIGKPSEWVPPEGAPENFGRRAPANQQQPYVVVQLAYSLQQSEVRGVAVFADGSEHPMTSDETGREGSLRQMQASLRGVTLKEVKTFRFESRPIRWASFPPLAVEPEEGAAASSQGASGGSTTNAQTALDDLSTQDLIGQIKELQDKLALLATVPHGPYVAGPNGPQEPAGLTAHVQQMREEIGRLNGELAKRAGG